MSRRYRRKPEARGRRGVDQPTPSAGAVSATCPSGASRSPYNRKFSRQGQERSWLRYRRIARHRARNLDKQLARQIELAGRRVAFPAVAARARRRLHRRIDGGGIETALTRRGGHGPADGAQQTKDDHKSDSSQTFPCLGADMGWFRHCSLKRSKQAETLHADGL